MCATCGISPFLYILVLSNGDCVCILPLKIVFFASDLWSFAGTICIHVRYHESQVCDVMTEPSVEAFLPTIILVHDIRAIPSRVVSSICDHPATGIASSTVKVHDLSIFIMVEVRVDKKVC